MPKTTQPNGFNQHYGFTLLPGEERRVCLPVALALRQFEGRPERPGFQIR